MGSYFCYYFCFQFKNSSHLQKEKDRSEKESKQVDAYYKFKNLLLNYNLIQYFTYVQLEVTEKEQTVKIFEQVDAYYTELGNLISIKFISTKICLQ